MGKLKLASAAGAPVSPAPVRLVAAAEPSGGAQIPASPPPWQAKRPSSRRGRIQSRGSNRRPSSAALEKKKKKNPSSSALAAGGDYNPAIIQSRGEKRRFYFCASSYSPAWGAKRARSPICGVKPVDPAPSQDVDWANLGDGPAGLIADLLLANDVADYVRFRAVCRPWRWCSPDPRTGGLDRRFLPRRWIMLEKAIPRCHRFLNISTGECIRMGLPELDEHRFLALTREGLLLLLHEPTLVLSLLNPLTRQLTGLPSMTTLLTKHQRAMRSMGEFISIRVFGVGLADPSTVAVRFSDPRVLAVAKPGDECWTVAYDGPLHSTLSFAGRFYCCVHMDVMVLNTTGSDAPRLLMAAEKNSSIHFSQMAHSAHLVDNAGELMLVHRSSYHDSQNNLERKYEVYRVDLDAGALVPAKSFDRRAVFMGCFRTISVAAEVFPSLIADTLYLGFAFDERPRIGMYNLADGSGTPVDGDDSSVEMHPCSVIDCLSHCVGGMGNKLA